VSSSLRTCNACHCRLAVSVYVSAAAACCSCALLVAAYGRKAVA
jgi:hypothetical protein